MREILFRGKTEKGKWVYGDLIHYVDRFVIREVGDYWIVSETVGQYTGLTDKNGKKIFEGDICKHRSYYSDNIVMSMVTYADGHFLAMPDENSGFELSHKLEVIGNIHDNPELLKGGEGDG